MSSQKEKDKKKKKRQSLKAAMDKALDDIFRDWK